MHKGALDLQILVPPEILRKHLTKNRFLLTSSRILRPVHSQHQSPTLLPLHPIPHLPNPVHPTELRILLQLLFEQLRH